MWAAHHYLTKEANNWHTSGGLGTMGFEVPAAMGVQVGSPGKEVWSIAGDGGFQMTLAELATVAENNLPIKYVILNNNMLGMITQWQDMVYAGGFHANTYTGNPDFVKLAEAYGIRGIRITSQDELMDGLREAREHDGPVIVDCVIFADENVYPMIPAGGTIEQLIEEPA